LGGGGVRQRVWGGSAGPIKGGGRGLGVRAQGEKLAGDLGEELSAGEERGRGEEGADRRGRSGRGRRE
jgi:hypothetical protein